MRHTGILLHQRENERSPQRQRELAMFDPLLPFDCYLSVWILSYLSKLLKIPALNKNQMTFEKLSIQISSGKPRNFIIRPTGHELIAPHHVLELLYSPQHHPRKVSASFNVTNRLLLVLADLKNTISHAFVTQNENYHH